LHITNNKEAFKYSYLKASLFLRFLLKACAMKKEGLVPDPRVGKSCEGDSNHNIFGLVLYLQVKGFFQDPRGGVLQMKPNQNKFWFVFLFSSLRLQASFCHWLENKKPETFVSGFLCGERGSDAFIIVPVNTRLSKRFLRTGSPIGSLDFQSLF